MGLMNTTSISSAKENLVERNLYVQRWAAWNTETKKKSGIEIPYSRSNGQKNRKHEVPIIPVIDVQLIAGRSIIVEKIVASCVELQELDFCFVKCCGWDDSGT